MRRLLTWLVVTLGIAAIARRLRKRSQAEETAVPVAEENPADELRQKLAESRAEEAPSAEPPAPSEASVEERRAEVHDQGRSALDEMREPTDT